MATEQYTAYLRSKPSARYTIGKHIRLYRLQRGWSQEVLAELANLNRTYVGSVERGEHNVGIDNVERIAQALDIPLCSLFGCTTPPSVTRQVTSPEPG